MITVPEVVERFVLESPFLEEGLAQGIVNLSALARRLKPQIEKELKKTVQSGAVVMALRRLGGGQPLRKPHTLKVLKNLGDITVRSSLVEFTFKASDSLLAKQKKLLQSMERSRDAFVAMTQGVTEVTMILSAALEKKAESVFAGETRISRLGELAAVTIRLPLHVVETPGVHYAILKQLAWRSINVVEVVSTLTEFTIIIRKADIDRAFTALKEYLWR
jgi:aspartokinase